MLNVENVLTTKKPIVNIVHTQDRDNDNECVFLGEIKTQNTSANWKVNLLVENKDICFKSDTGADIKVISLELYESLPSSMGVLCHPSKTLYVVGGVQLKRGDNSTNQEVYVVAKLEFPLIGRPAIEALGLAKKNKTTMTVRPNVQWTRADSRRIYPTT